MRCIDSCVAEDDDGLDGAPGMPPVDCAEGSSSSSAKGVAPKRGSAPPVHGQINPAPWESAGQPAVRHSEAAACSTASASEACASKQWSPSAEAATASRASDRREAAMGYANLPERRRGQNRAAPPKSTRTLTPPPHRDAARQNRAAGRRRFPGAPPDCRSARLEAAARARTRPAPKTEPDSAGIFRGCPRLQSAAPPPCRIMSNTHRWVRRFGTKVLRMGHDPYL